MKYYHHVLVYDVDGKCHDVDIYTSYEWTARLRATRRACERMGINYKSAYIGGNIWTRRDLITA